MNDNDIVTCLANILSIAGSDKKFLPQEQEVIEKVRMELGAENAHMEQAVALIHAGEYHITPAGRFSDQIRNIEDMLLVSMADHNLAQEEKTEILHFAKKIKLTQEQINKIMTQTKSLIKSGACVCRSCGNPLEKSDNFCTECGAKNH